MRSCLTCICVQIPACAQSFLYAFYYISFSIKLPNAHVYLPSLYAFPSCSYGLLGASGCGKTTLLSCIVGRRRLNSGEIWVLGGRPGSPGSGVPGPRIGYMPQVSRTPCAVWIFHALFIALPQLASWLVTKLNKCNKTLKARMREKHRNKNKTKAPNKK